MLKQIIAPSVLNANFLELGNGLKAIENGGAGLVHLDIMDGHFVPNISFGPGISACVKKGTKLPLDCHLMIENPENYVGEFAKAGASIISVHAETTNHLDRLLHQIAEHHQCACRNHEPSRPFAAPDCRTRRQARSRHQSGNSARKHQIRARHRGHGSHHVCEPGIRRPKPHSLLPRQDS